VLKLQLHLQTLKTSFFNQNKPLFGFVFDAGWDFSINLPVKLQYFMLRYSRTISAANVNRSGSRANGPSPNILKPKIDITIGLETRAYKRSVAENIISPIVNSDCVFLYMSMYEISRNISIVTLIVDTTVFAM